MFGGMRIARRRRRRSAIEPSLLSVAGFALITLLASMGTAGAASSPDPAEASRTVPVEVAHLRTEKSETFLQADGSLKTVLSSLPLHYRDGAKGWKKIENELVESKRAGFKWSNKEAGFALDLKEDVRDGAVRFAAGDTAFTLTLEGAAASVGAKRSDAEVGGAKAVVYKNVLEQTDLEYVLLPTGVKETLVLQKQGAPHEFVFRLTPALGKELTLVPRGDGGLDVRTAASAEPVAVISAPVVNDSARIEVDDDKGKRSVVVDDLAAPGKVRMSSQRRRGRFLQARAVHRRSLA